MSFLTKKEWLTLLIAFLIGLVIFFFIGFVLVAILNWISNPPELL